MRLRIIISFLISIYPCTANSDLVQVPTEIEADTLIYDHNKDAALGRGNVKILQEKEVIFADEVIYHKKEDKLYAKGHVIIIREDKSVYYADIINFQHQSHKGRLLSFKARFGKNSLFSSYSAEIKDKKHIKLNSIVFSPCKVCKNNIKPFMPLWQVRASEATIDMEEERIKYKNARIETYGIPIFYTPYFSTPTPGAKRKTGLLAPGLTGSSLNGSSIKIPFYLNISPDKDFTYSPAISTNKNRPTIHEMEFRHKLRNGSYQFSGSITEGQKLDKDGNKMHGKYLYGHINGNGDFVKNNGLLSGEYYGFQIQRVRDPSLTYTKLYNLLSDDVLTTKLYHRKLENNYYIESNALLFQDLRPGFYDVTTPQALPLINAQHNKKIDNIDATMKTKLNALHILRLEGNSYKRVSFENETKKQVQIPYGQLLEVSVKARGDAYQVTRKNIKNTNAKASYTAKHPGDYGRFLPQIKAKWSYPLLRKTNTNSILLEPIVQVISSPNANMNKNIPNEDSQTFELTATTLFSDNKYTGLDIAETGNRASYGVNGHITSPIIDKINFLFGQSYNMKKGKYTESSGLYDRFSDYVAQFEYELSKTVSLLHRTRLDKKSMHLNRNEISGLYQNTKSILSIDYTFASNKTINNNLNIFREEISVLGGYNFYDEWWIKAKSRKNLGKRPIGIKMSTISNALGLNYMGECLNMELEVRRDYTKLKNLKPSTVYFFKITVPTF